VATLRSAWSGIQLDIWTDQEAFQVYSCGGQNGMYRLLLFAFPLVPPSFFRSENMMLICFGDRFHGPQANPRLLQRYLAPPRH
jgi:hypothetical protein